MTNWKREQLARIRILARIETLTEGFDNPFHINPYPRNTAEFRAWNRGLEDASRSI